MVIFGIQNLLQTFAFIKFLLDSYYPMIIHPVFMDGNKVRLFVICYCIYIQNGFYSLNKIK